MVTKSLKVEMDLWFLQLLVEQDVVWAFLLSSHGKQILFEVMEPLIFKLVRWREER
jgi:hypothetical protein